MSWRKQIEPLAEADFRVVAPDMRGYNLSSKPDGVDPYGAGKLATDVRGLIQERGAESALVAGHDWGRTAAWTLAMNHPEVVDRLAILNAAHPRKLNWVHHDEAERVNELLVDLRSRPDDVAAACWAPWSRSPPASSTSATSTPALPTVLRSFCCTAGHTTSTRSPRSRRGGRQRATG
jgi:pimeloyl-ACP methyl ester carboxylesterase